MQMQITKHDDTVIKEQVKHKAWHALTAEDVLHHLEVREGGLSTEQAAQRLAQYGQNQLLEA